LAAAHQVGRRTASPGIKARGMRLEERPQGRHVLSNSASPCAQGVSGWESNDLPDRVFYQMAQCEWLTKQPLNTIMVQKPLERGGHRAVHWYYLPCCLGRPPKDVRSPAPGREGGERRRPSEQPE
jgi:hypothetical protein